MMDLVERSNRIRIMTLESIHSIGTGHVGGSLSIVDLLTCLYFGGLMRVDPKRPKKEDRDRLVVSKGHAGPALYAALVEKGYFDRKELLTLNQIGTILPSHCDMTKTPGVDMTAGSLGQGFSCAVGIAIAAKIQNRRIRTYAILGDGESQEGQVWEAAMLAAHKKLNNLIAFTDYNKCQLDGKTDDVMSLGDLEEKWRAFGWAVFRIDGHDHAAIIRTVEESWTIQDRPIMILLDTIKGKGVPEIEAMGYANHSMKLTDALFDKAVAELGGSCDGNA